MADRLALHTWTLDTTPFPAALAAASRTGWNAVEIRSLDFERAVERGGTAEDVLGAARASGLRVACVGARHGWMFADEAGWSERRRWLAGCCRWARSLGAGLVMSPVDFATGPVGQAGDRLRALGDVAAEHGVRLALEHQSQAPQLNTLERAREVVSRAGHPACGLLVDAYHVHRSGDLAAFEALPPEEIFYFQYSDVPADARPGVTLPRLPPGQGTVPFREVFAILAGKGYPGWLSYEAPNERAWARDPEAVAREAAVATRALLSGAGALGLP
jgi:sugar phosphate isomerase/epimerase